jgi:hypothetical protein
MDMRVRGKRPHGQKEVGGPTLKTFCLESVGVGNQRSPATLEEMHPACQSRAAREIFS